MDVRNLHNENCFMRLLAYRQPRGGVTIVSTLVVVATITVLIALLTVTYRIVQRNMRIAATRVTLRNLSGMAAELEAAGGWQRIEASAPPSWYYLGATEVMPGNVSVDGVDRYDSSVRHTTFVIEEITRVPSNYVGMQTIFTARFTAPAGQPAMPNHPVVLDAWGDPILFVPSGGMTNVWIGGVWHGPDNPFQPSDRRSFFVSAGPDANFMEGDDNIFSFD